MADEPTPESTQAPPAQLSGPWEADIRAAFTDPTVQATVDAFLRSKVQPRMTQLEQSVAAADNAKQLWDAFQADPATTYAEITRELYGPEHGQAALEYLEQRLTATPAPAETPPVAEPARQQFDPETQLSPDEVQAWRQEQELKQYDRALDEVLSDPANKDIDRDLFHTYVAAAEGDFENAVARYRAHVAEVLTRYGIDPASATPAQQGAAAEVAEGEASTSAPPVMGSEVAGNGVNTPTQPEYRGTEGLHRAIEDATRQSLSKRGDQAPPIS